MLRECTCMAAASWVVTAVWLPGCSKRRPSWWLWRLVRELITMEREMLSPQEINRWALDLKFKREIESNRFNVLII